MSLASLALALLLSCSNSKDTPESIAQKWCDLNSKVFNAPNDEARQKAEKDLKDYEKKIDQKYEGDEEMRKKVMAEVEKCEGASETPEK